MYADKNNHWNSHWVKILPLSNFVRSPCPTEVQAKEVILDEFMALLLGIQQKKKAVLQVFKKVQTSGMAAWRTVKIVACISSWSCTSFGVQALQSLITEEQQKDTNSAYPKHASRPTQSNTDNQPYLHGLVRAMG